MRVMDVADLKEGRLMELDIRNSGMSQKTVNDFKEVGQETLPDAHFMHPEQRRTTSATLKDQDSRRGSKWSVTSIRGRRQVCRIRPGNTPRESERTDVRKTRDSAECQKYHADVGTRGGRV